MMLISKNPVFTRISNLFCSQYNHTNENYFNIVKNRSYISIMSSAKEVMREALPIKCMEAGTEFFFREDDQT